VGVFKSRHGGTLQKRKRIHGFTVLLTLIKSLPCLCFVQPTAEKSNKTELHLQKMSALKIRDVRADNLTELLDLNQSNLPHVGSISMSEMEHLHRQAVYFRAAEFDGHRAGFLIAFDPTADYNSPNFLWFKNRYDAFVYIDRIVVAPDSRRKGIAFFLYRDLEHFAAQNDIPIMTCEYNLRPQNEISRQFHQKYGFKEVGTQKTENGKKTVSLQIKQVVPPSSTKRPRKR
jgi:predicted GNAT superfamily acetyltransferase